MKISVRTLTGEAAELDLDPKTTVAGLRALVEERLAIPADEQRFIYAGHQLEEVSSAAWRARRSSGVADLARAMGVSELPDGTPLTLEHHGLQKGSVVNVVRKAVTPSAAAAARAAAADGGGPVGAAAARVRFGSEPDGETEPGLAAAAARTTPELPGGDPAAAAAVAGGGGGAPAAALSAGLQALSDLDLLTLLRPLLQGRPAVRAALLAEEQPLAAAAPRSMTAASPGMGVAAVAAAAAAYQPQAAASPVPSGSVGWGQLAGPLASPLQYAQHDQVAVWSNSAQRWFQGEVVSVAEQGTDVIPQGSVEVAFELGRKWIAPADIPRALVPR